jgi:GTP 3',8-cyclase
MKPVSLGLPTLRGRPSSANPDQANPGQQAGDRPDGPGLFDRFGRTATDLRVSLTDRCNLRCGYCMPPEGLDWMPDAQQLTDTEVVRLIRIAVEDLGVTAVRFTGGEPLLRRGLEDIVAATAALRTQAGLAPITALTTNGLGLARRAPALKAAGLNRVNVSLDTLDPERFARITHRDRHHDVLAGLAAARAAGLAPVKINTVLLPGINDDEAVPLLTWALSEGYELRFIEQMPLDPQGSWDRTSMVTAHDILTQLSAVFDLEPQSQQQRGAAPAQSWFVGADGLEATGGRRPRVGIIASVTRPFCGDCDRTRLTADGQLRDCLFAHGETDLRGLLRRDADDEAIAQAWQATMWAKRAGHGIDDPSFLQPDRPMSAIGG